MTYTSSQDRFSQVLNGGFCIGCGACAAISQNIIMEEGESGLYQAKVVDNVIKDEGEVCPFSSTVNEDAIGFELYGSEAFHDTRVGYYRNIYAGSVLEGDFRQSGSSGGVVTWVLSRLLDLGEIDGVVHVGETGQVGELFEYRISETKADIINNSKSRYYPVHVDDVLKKIRSTNKRYAFVGVPCFVKAIRLLVKNDSDLSANIKFCISIFCGHFKTKAFSELIALQQGIEVKNLAGVNFRVKSQDQPADRYSIQLCESKDGERLYLPSTPTRNLYGMDWGLGYFKPKACDWCDDIAGETADLACGDAWLPEFSEDSAGTNIVVIRNKVIDDVITDGMREKQLGFIEQTVDKVYESQAGNYRHRQEGLSLRVFEADKHMEWHPMKRIKADSFNISEDRARIYRLRYEIAEKSHEVFKLSKKKLGFISFYIRMLPLELRYYSLNKRLIKGGVKSLLTVQYYFLNCTFRLLSILKKGLLK